MRLCVYTKTWRASGTGLVAQSLSRALADAGAEVLHIAPPSEDGEFDAPRPGLTRWRTPRELPVSAPKPLRALKSGARILSACAALLAARLRTRTFVITIPDPLIATVPVFALLRILGARLVYVVHDPLPHAWQTGGALRAFEKLGFQLAYALASDLVVLTKQGEAALRGAWRLGDKPVSVIEHGDFALSEQPPPPNTDAESEDVLLVFGSLRANKGIQEAIEGVVQARREGARVRLLIAGEPHGPERSYWEACRERALRHPEAITVREGYVRSEALPALVGETAAFLMPYRDFHSQSGVAVLAASNARPVIGSRQGGLGALIDEGLPGIAIEPPGDANAVAEAIRRFAGRDRVATAAACLAYRERFLQARGWPAIAQAYLRLVFPGRAAAQASPSTAGGGELHPGRLA